MIKLIASDLDGTLLRGGAQSLDPAVYGLIKKMTDKGILFVAASGRQYPNLRRLFAPVQDDIAYICENGCISFYQNQKIHKAVMERELGDEMLHAIWEKDTAEILLSGEDTCYVHPKDMSYYYHLRDVVRNNVTLVDDIFHVQEDYFKISVYEDEGFEKSEQYWHDKFGNRATVVTAGFEWLDMMPKGVHKGMAMDKLLNHLGIAPDECMAFGDNYNDLEMLSCVGTAYVMDTAPEDIKKITPYHTSKVEDVLEAFLKNLD